MITRSLKNFQFSGKGKDKTDTRPDGSESFSRRVWLRIVGDYLILRASVHLTRTRTMIYLFMVLKRIPKIDLSAIFFGHQDTKVQSFTKCYPLAPCTMQLAPAAASYLTSHISHLPPLCPSVLLCVSPCKFFFANFALTLRPLRLNEF